MQPDPPSDSQSQSQSPSSSATPWRANLVSLDNPHPSPLSGTRDLISHFHLEPLYDTFLRPYLPSSLSSSHHALAGGGGAHTDADQLSLGGASGGAGGGGAGLATTIGGQQSNSTHATTMTTLPLVPGQVVLPSGGAGGRNQTQTQRGGAHVKATPASPAGTSTSAAAAQGGLKITLGGIKLAGLNAPSLAVGGGGGEGTPQKKPRKPKMEKSYEYMVGDVLGRISQPRANATSSSASSSSSLLHLVSNPDPAPCPPLHPFDAQQLREAFTLKPGTLAGFDMSIWEARDPNGGVGGGPGDERRRKKKKRKHDDPNATDPKKQRR